MINKNSKNFKTISIQLIHKNRMKFFKLDNKVLKMIINQNRKFKMKMKITRKSQKRTLKKILNFLEL